MSNHYTALDNSVLKSLVNDDTYSIFKSDLITQRKDKSLVIKILSYLEDMFFYEIDVLRKNLITRPRRIKTRDFQLRRDL